MFCPRCGGPAESTGSRLVCVDTGMDFSPVVAEELKRYVALPPQDVPAASFRWGGGWFCPADAIVMTEVDGRVVCPSCARAMPGRLIYNLVEFHVHPTPSR